MKLHIGCGGIKLDGFVNIDVIQRGITDIVAKAQALPIEDDCIDRIESYHLIEHISHPEVFNMLREWRRVMKKGAVLIVECPDFDETVKEYIIGNWRRIYNIYGLQRFPGDAHLFGYNFQRLKELLIDTGFSRIRNEEAQDYHSKEEPCLRLKCQK